MPVNGGTKTETFLIYTFLYLIARNVEYAVEDSLHTKCSFPLKISSVNVTKSSVSGGFGHIYSVSIFQRLLWIGGHDKMTLEKPCDLGRVKKEMGVAYS